MFLDALLPLAHATAATTNLLGGKMQFKLRALLAIALVGAFIFAPPAVPVQAKPPVSLGDGRAEEVGMSTQRLDKITSAFTKEINDKKLPGAVVIVARKGRVVYQNAFGLRDPKKSDPMGVDTIFRIYSMTKPLMSVGLMTFVEDGVVQLTDPVSKYLPPFKDVKVSTPTGDVAPDRPMTVQDLLRHTSGLAYGEITKNEKVKDALTKAGIVTIGIEYDSRNMTGKEEVERLAMVPLVNQPGTLWEYSLAVDVQGRIIEAVTGKRAGDFLAERVFKPLGMKDTGFFVPQAEQARLAEAFETDPVSGNKYPLIDVSKQPGNDSGGAGGVSTAIDYLRFIQMLLNDGTLDGVRVLSPTTVRLMTSDHLAGVVSNPQMPGELLLGSKGYTFGLGFAVRIADGIAAFPGTAGDYNWAGYAGTYFWVDPAQDLVAVLMTQAPSPARAGYRRLLRQLVYQAIVD
jgi:CubicO group peptidase (beta-lactamase class C family)